MFVWSCCAGVLDVVVVTGDEDGAGAGAGDLDPPPKRARIVSRLFTQY